MVIPGRNWFRWGFVFVVLLALGLRCLFLGAEGFWFDETASRWLAGGVTFWDFLERNASETTPPLYFLLLRGWWGLMVGLGWEHPSVAGFRLVNVLLDLGSVALLMILLRRTVGPGVALLAGVCFACNPLSIHFAQDLRMYPAGTFATLGAVVALERFLTLRRRLTIARSRRRVVSVSSWFAPDRGALILFGCSCAAMVMTHYVLAVLCLALGIWAFLVLGWRRDWGGMGLVTGVSLVSALATLVWLVIPLGFYGGLQSAGAKWMVQPTVADGMRALWAEFWLGPTENIPKNETAPAIWVALATAFLLVGGLWNMKPRVRRLVVYCGFVGVAGTLFAWVPGFFGTVLLNPVRFPTFVVPLFLGVLATLCWQVRRPVGIAAGTLIAGFLLCSLAMAHVGLPWHSASAFRDLLRSVSPLQPQVLFVTDEYLEQGVIQHGPEFRPEFSPDRIRPIFRQTTSGNLVLNRVQLWNEFTQLDPRRPVAFVQYYYRHFSDAPDGSLAGLLHGTMRHRTVLGEQVSVMSLAAQALGPLDRRVLEGNSMVAQLGWPSGSVAMQDEIFPPVDVLGCVEGFVNPYQFQGLATDNRRWSKGTGILTLPTWHAADRLSREATATLFVEMAPMEIPGYQPDLLIRCWRENRPDVFGELKLEEWTSGPLALECAIPAGTGPLKLAFHMKTFNPSKLGISQDNREMGLHWSGLGLRYSVPPTDWWQGRSPLSKP